MTSHDVVDVVRRVTGEQRVGHAGTLDPLASGVLVVGVGRAATKQLATVVAKDKEYVATIELGATTETDDAEGARLEHEVTHRPVIEDISRVIADFVGEILQSPPRYSAIKVKGQPAHRRMRRGEAVELQPRRVTIYEIEIIAYHWPELILRVRTGPGVYIRSLARDIGEGLVVGGYLKELVRTRVGQFRINDAVNVDQMSSAQKDRE